MSNAWHPDITLASKPVGPAGWLRVAARGTLVIFVLVAGLALLLVLRLIERPIWRHNRPWTQAITQAVCRLALGFFGLRYRVVGTRVRGSGALVANHSSWLDIFALNASERVYFVAKSEVAGWPGIGWLARATGTVFIRRRGRDARMHRDIFEARLRAGHRLLFFPEGTSTDGTLVLPFKSTLFAAFFRKELHAALSIQPVTISYQPPDGEALGYYGWWGDMVLGSHIVKVLATRRQGSVTINYHTPLNVRVFADRKALALACEDAVRAGMPCG